MQIPSNHTEWVQPRHKGDRTATKDRQPCLVVAHAPSTNKCDQGIRNGRNQ